jgi:hypothetical protein
MSQQEIYDPWPSIHWKHSDSSLQFHLKAINGEMIKTSKDHNILLRNQNWENEQSMEGY